MLYPQVCPDPAEAAGGGAHERPAVPHPAEDAAHQPGPGRRQEEGGQRHRAALPGARAGGEEERGEGRQEEGEEEEPEGEEEREQAGGASGC